MTRDRINQHFTSLLVYFKALVTMLKDETKNSQSLIKGFCRNSENHCSHDFQKIKWISGSTVSEVRKRKIYLAVVSWAPKQKIKQLLYKSLW